MNMDLKGLLPPNIKEKDLLKIIGILVGFLVTILLGSFVFPLIGLLLVIAVIFIVGYVIRAAIFKK